MKTKDEILSLLFFERGSSDSTRKSYTRTVNVFEKVTGLTLPEMLTIAEDQEDNNVSWKNRDLRTWLITYRKYVYENYKKRTAKSYLTLVISVFRHFEITVEKLPYFSTVSATPSIPINPDLLVDRDVLRLSAYLPSLSLHILDVGLSYCQ